jgi:hypothetical protein
MARTLKSFEADLLKNGTAVGPVTPEMIALAKELYKNVCEELSDTPSTFGWEDFLPDARRDLKVGTWLTVKS